MLGSFNIPVIIILIGSILPGSNALLDQSFKGTAQIDPTGTELFLLLISSHSKSVQDDLLESIEKHWHPAYASMAIEIVYMTQDPSLSFKLMTLLHEKTGKTFGYEFNEWYDWLWNLKEQKPRGYARFKAELYKRIDPRFKKYFAHGDDATTIRLDEVRWGGVLQDGIPPLRSPEMITAQEATYLEDDNVVFGIEVNGDVRAYPKRILAWHEMFVDNVGGTPVAGVYCTLCGTVVLYKTEHNGINHALGTSGFLYRSNKLMYDQATHSLWNTLQGEPVIGPLIGKDIVLEHLRVVTTTWGAWKRKHPTTSVLSLNTGHHRDYGEGVAYAAYFSTDELMFNTPYNDQRLNNKQEVLALRFPQKSKEQLAISTNFLEQNVLFTETLGQQKFIVLTDKYGANRVYELKSQFNFSSYDGHETVLDERGISWTVHESHMISERGEKLSALPYHRAFWFGWLAAFPDTRLIK